MDVTFDKFYSYLEDLLNSYTKLSALLKDKIEAADNFDIVRLDEIIRDEQVYLLISKGFDQNIENFKKELGLKGDTLGETIESMPADFQSKFAEIHTKLSEALNKSRSLNNECQELIKERLQGIERRLRELGKNAEAQANYPNQKNPDPGGHSFSKSI